MSWETRTLKIELKSLGLTLALMLVPSLVGIEASQASMSARVKRFGIFPSWGLSQKVSCIIGHNRACEVSLTAMPLTAEQAERWGLVNRLVEETELLKKAREERGHEYYDGMTKEQFKKMQEFIGGRKKPPSKSSTILGDRVLLLSSHCSAAGPWFAHRLDTGSAHALWIDWPGFVLFLQCIPLVMDVAAIFLGRSRPLSSEEALIRHWCWWN
ncbi:hypothetical protein RHSIM_Rhsim04G0217200 [Rhododendron simsii]|uniref:Uncharacterized protein n=1 Tax=Rhododendron simsii TaxID=118357 RepID=A0A834LR79_RHOSS|nr:hypothetical protein RHSIM_Rhsim04G0217200 [Rhododendron simsii]